MSEDGSLECQRTSRLAATINSRLRSASTASEYFQFMTSPCSVILSLPLNAPAEDTNYTYKKALIVLSDGLNTEDRWPANGNGMTQYGGAIDTIQQTLCTNIKNSGVIVYAIQLNTGSPGDPTSTALQNCASGLDKFYHVRDATQTLTVFNSIGTSLAKLRVAK